MPRKVDPKAQDYSTIRRALHSAAGTYETYFSEFTATWHDAKTNRNVDFTGTIDSQISLKTARIHGQDKVHNLREIFTNAEMRAFNYLINAENSGRMRGVG
jgi:hypothetical protein